MKFMFFCWGQALDASRSFIIFLVTNTNTLLSGLYLISTRTIENLLEQGYTVSMPSRAYTSFLLDPDIQFGFVESYMSMPSRAYTSFLPQAVATYLLTFTTSVNALSGLYLISTVPLQKPRFYAASRTCFCRYLSEYSDNSRFSCMLTFWTYLMRFTYP